MKKRFLATFLAMLMVLTAMVVVPVSAKTYGDWEYEIADGKATVTRYWGSGTAVTIPATLGGCPVTSIGAWAFEKCYGLTSIIIPYGVTSIGNDAFEFCTLLKSITIPNSVTSIGEYAFCGCYELTRVTIPASVTFIGDGAFYFCNSLSGIEVDGKNTVYTSINGVLYNKAVSTLIAFPGAQTSIVIPASVTGIGVFAFNHCYSLSKIGVDSQNTVFTSIDGVVYNKDVSVLVVAPCAKTSVIIPDSVIIIGEYAFDGCLSLMSVTIPDSVTEIHRGAFASCASLTNVVIPDSVTFIGDYAFNICSSLKTVYYAGSVNKWHNIPLGHGNDPLLNANIIFNYKVPSPTPGDANGDNRVNAKDIIDVMKYMLGSAPAGFNKEAADLNGDDRVNAKDIILIMKIMLGAK